MTPKGQAQSTFSPRGSLDGVVRVAPCRGLFAVTLLAGMITLWLCIGAGSAFARDAPEFEFNPCVC